MNNITADKLKQFQDATGEPVATAISYLESEEGLVLDAIDSYRADKAAAAAGAESPHGA